MDKRVAKMPIAAGHTPAAIGKQMHIFGKDHFVLV